MHSKKQNIAIERVHETIQNELNAIMNTVELAITVANSFGNQTPEDAGVTHGDNMKIRCMANMIIERVYKTVDDASTLGILSYDETWQIKVKIHEYVLDNNTGCKLSRF